MMQNGRITEHFINLPRQLIVDMNFPRQLSLIRKIANFSIPGEISLQELITTVRRPHGGRQLSWNCHVRCPSVRT